MSYIDGFVAAVPTANKEKYIAHAKIAAEMFREFGALKVVETWGVKYQMVRSHHFPWQLTLKATKPLCFRG